MQLEWQGVITGEGDQPLGTLESVAAELTALFPGLSFDWSRTGMDELAPVDVKAVRRRLGKSQSEFACMIGVSVSTLQNWEQGRRRPEGPARALLRVAAANPEAVAAALAQ